LEDRFTLSHNNPFSVFGYVKGINADHATINMLYYTSRLSGGPIGIETAFGPTTGTFDWTPFCFDLTIPGNGNYGNIELSNSPPFDDQGYVWFDEIKLIKWDDEWYQIPVEIPVPNNYRFLQIRGSAGADQEILVNYTLNKYDLKPFDNGLQ
jgi:hypothetical protein